MVEARASPRREVLVFEVDGQLYGLAAAEIRELLRAVTIRSLPLAPPGVEGVINLRGTTVPVLDLRLWLRLPAKPVEPSDHLVLFGPDPRPVALRVDRVLELATLEVDVVGAGRPQAAEEGVGEVARRSTEIVPLLDLRALARLAAAVAPPPALPGEAAPAGTGGRP